MDHVAGSVLPSLALVLGVAAATTVLFQRLRQPVVLGYLLAGLVVGPHLPIPLVADEQTVHTLAQLGVILLLFSIGLEFSLRKLIRVGPRAGVVAVIQVAIMLWLGMVVGRLFGWTPIEALFCGALIAISSTTIIAKAFAEQRPAAGLRELVFAILIVEDLVGILLLALLTTVAGAGGASAGALGEAALRLGAFLAALLIAGLLLVPRAMRWLVRRGGPDGGRETVLVAALAICFAVALLADRFGYSVALGAFLAGSLVAESGEAEAVEHVVAPVRDLFGALFFVAVGMMIDPAQLAAHAAPIAVLTVVVVVGKVLGVSLGALLAGYGVRSSLSAGMSLAQIGEFSFIIAGLGVERQATREFLYPVAVAVSAITTLVTPWLIRAAPRVGDSIDRHLPAPLSILVALYGSWVEALGERPSSGLWSRLRRPAVRQLTDATLLGAVVIAAALGSRNERISALAERLPLSGDSLRFAVVLGAMLLSAPLLLGLLSRARRIGHLIAVEVLPEVEPAPGQQAVVDLASAPRRAFVVALQLGCVLLVGVPLLAVTQPFLGGYEGAVVLVLALVAVAVPFWRSAESLEGHVRAGAEVLLEAMARQSQGDAGHDGHGDEPVEPRLPGLGAPVAVHIAPGWRAVGRTLAQLQLRGETGATVLAIRRDGAAGSSAAIPTGHEVLAAGDVLAVAGTHEAIAAARALLGPVTEGPGARPPS